MAGDPSNSSSVPPQDEPERPDAEVVNSQEDSVTASAEGEAPSPAAAEGVVESAATAAEPDVPVGAGNQQMPPYANAGAPPVGMQFPRSLCVSGFQEGETDENTLRDIFARVGRVTSVSLRGKFAFVTMGDSTEAYNAKLALNGTPVAGGGQLAIIDASTSPSPGQRRAQGGDYTHHRGRYGGGMGGGGRGRGGGYGRGRYMQPGRYGMRGVTPSGPTQNLHVTGYGQGTTKEEIREFFSRACKVENVVMKSYFCFVNTPTVEAACSAVSSLQGQPIRGQPINIKFAKQMVDFSQSTKNLYVGGFAADVKKEEIKQAFASVCTVTDVAMKEGYAFVNTESVEDAERAMEQLQGCMVGANPILIKYAKVLPFQTETRGLHVTGFGEGTTEEKVKEAFTKEMPDTEFSVVWKDSYCFVNTPSVEDAKTCMRKLKGCEIEGGVIKINFAKERSMVSGEGGRGGGYGHPYHHHHHHHHHHMHRGGRGRGGRGFRGGYGGRGGRGRGRNNRHGMMHHNEPGPYGQHGGHGARGHMHMPPHGAGDMVQGMGALSLTPFDAQQQMAHRMVPGGAPVIDVNGSNGAAVPPMSGMAAAALAAPAGAPIPVMLPQLGSGVPSDPTTGGSPPSSSPGASLPPPWQEAFDPNYQQTYFYNAVTGESSWADPRSLAMPVACFDLCDGVPAMHTEFLHARNTRGAPQAFNSRAFNCSRLSYVLPECSSSPNPRAPYPVDPQSSENKTSSPNATPFTND